MKNIFETGMNALGNQVENAPQLKALEMAAGGDSVPEAAEEAPAAENPAEVQTKIEDTKEDLGQLYDDQEGG